MAILYGFDEVRGLLPQSHPFILVDAVEQFTKEESIVCIKNISGNEWVFPGHFPDKSIYPGVLLIEGMAQSAILLFKLGLDDPYHIPGTFVLSRVKAQFLAPVVPGNQVRYECRVVKMISTAGIMECEAKVEGTIAAKAELAFACISQDEQRG